MTLRHSLFLSPKSWHFSTFPSVFNQGVCFWLFRRSWQELSTFGNLIEPLRSSRFEYLLGSFSFASIMIRTVRCYPVWILRPILYTVYCKCVTGFPFIPLKRAIERGEVQLCQTEHGKFIIIMTTPFFLYYMVTVWQDTMKSTECRDFLVKVK